MSILKDEYVKELKQNLLNELSFSEWSVVSRAPRKKEKHSRKIIISCLEH